jgi:hypothetical protein
MPISGAEAEEEDKQNGLLIARFSIDNEQLKIDNCGIAFGNDFKSCAKHIL